MNLPGAMRQEKLGGLKVRILGEQAEGPTVVLMHGFGAPGSDLVGLAGAIRAPAGTCFVFPEAPLLLPPELAGGAGRAWWMIDMMRLQMAMMSGQIRDLSKEEPEGMAEARSKVVAMLEALDAERLVLGGFSQGAMLAVDVALRHDMPLEGLIVMSGTYLAEDVWTPKMKARAGLPVVQSHGRADPLLPFELAERLHEAFDEAGLEVDFVPFEGGHGVPPGALAAVGSLLARVGRADQPSTSS